MLQLPGHATVDRNAHAIDSERKKPLVRPPAARRFGDHESHNTAEKQLQGQLTHHKDRVLPFKIIDCHHDDLPKVFLVKDLRQLATLIAPKTGTVAETRMQELQLCLPVHRFTHPHQINPVFS